VSRRLQRVDRTGSSWFNGGVRDWVVDRVDRFGRGSGNRSLNREDDCKKADLPSESEDLDLLGLAGNERGTNGLRRERGTAETAWGTASGCGRGMAMSCKDRHGKEGRQTAAGDV